MQLNQKFAAGTLLGPFAAMTLLVIAPGWGIIEAW
jgi:hypothetical protein